MEIRQWTNRTRTGSNHMLKASCASQRTAGAGQGLCRPPAPRRRVGCHRVHPRPKHCCCLHLEFCSIAAFIEHAQGSHVGKWGSVKIGLEPCAQHHQVSRMVSPVPGWAHLFYKKCVGEHGKLSLWSIRATSVKQIKQGTWHTDQQHQKATIGS